MRRRSGSVCARCSSSSRRTTDAPRVTPPPAEVGARLGAGGPLRQALPSFEPRPQQLRMAQEVSAALVSGRHLLIEAGTGIGKSVAYLLPAILRALRPEASPEERRVVVS